MLLEDNESFLLYNIRFDDSNNAQLKIENIDYSEAQQLMSELQFIYAETEEGGIGTYTTDDDNDYVFYTAGLKPIHTKYCDFPRNKYN